MSIAKKTSIAAALSGMVITGALATAMTSIGFSPAAHAATNPYTPQEACNHQFGGTWTANSGGHRSVRTSSGLTWGDVYLMYNSATGYNCVATIKSAYVGTPSQTEASLWVQGDPGWTRDIGSYSYYAAVQKKAAGKCVQYEGVIWNPSFTDVATGGRYTWDNCA